VKRESLNAADCRHERLWAIGNGLAKFNAHFRLSTRRFFSKPPPSTRSASYFSSPAFVLPFINYINLMNFLLYSIKHSFFTSSTR